MLENTRNVALSHVQIETMRKQRANYETPGPNRRARREEDQAPRRSSNRKITRGRMKQRAELTYRDKNGEVQGTGLYRTIVHKLVPAKVARSWTNIMKRKADERRDRIEAAEKASEGAAR